MENRCIVLGRPFGPRPRRLGPPQSGTGRWPQRRSARQAPLRCGHHAWCDARCAHGGALAGNSVVLGRRQGLASEHRESFGEAPGWWWDGGLNPWAARR
jgi:hypothetical protein